MRLNKIYTAVLLLVLILPILAACGGATGTGQATSAPAGETAAAEGGAGTAAETPEATPAAEETTAAAEMATAAETATTEETTAAETATADETATAAETATADETATAAETATADETATAGETTTAGATATAGGAAAGGATVAPAQIGQELVNAFAGEYEGTVVTMAGPFTGEDETRWNENIAPFEEQTGIDIQYAGSKEFEASISIQVEGGNPPDIVDFPQPGLMANFARSGRVLDVREFINEEWLTQNYNQGYLDTATVEGQNGEILGGVFHRVNGKSLVWYPKAAFDEAGYQVPETWDEMTALMDEIVADGDTPWCIGIQSGAATGWPATDWMEDIMLRTTSLENYDRWVSGDLPFTSPEVKNAAQIMSDIWLNDQYVYGGRQQIVSTDFGASVTPMFAEPEPDCWLHRQGNFIVSFFPEDAEAGVDYDFFYLPPIDPQYGEPVLFAGDLMSAFNDRPEVRAVMQYFTTFDSVKGWVAAGGAISPHKNSDLSAYTNEVDRGVAEIILNATSARFDASDLMPGEVGAGTFWRGMTNYISGSVNLDQAMEEIQAGWNTAGQ